MTDVASRVDAWVHGWVVSRGTAPAQRIPGGWYITTASDTEAERRVLTSERWVASTADAVMHSSVLRPSWIKFPLELGDASPELPPRWTLSAVDFLMVSDLTGGQPGEARVPEGYRLTAGWDGDCATAELWHGSEIAARGRSGVSGRVAVPDQIITDPRHRRRGLGRVIMRQLSASASTAGAIEEVLVATGDGRALYEALGWTTLARIPAIVLADEPSSGGSPRS